MYHETWNKEVVRQQLSSEMNTPEFLAAYQQLRIQHPALMWLVKPEALIGRLHSISDDYAEKDHLLHVIISAIQREPESRQCGFTLLSLAMWPALEHSYYKLFHLASCLPDLWAEIHGSFLDAVMRFNLAKTSRLAINLQLNVEKAVRSTIAKESRVQATEQAYGFLNVDIDLVLADPYRGRNAQIKELLDQIPDRTIKRGLRSAPSGKAKVHDSAELEVMADALHALVERDLITPDEERLLADHILRGLSLEDIAKSVGSHGNTIRVKFFRVKAKLRAHFGGRKVL